MTFIIQPFLNIKKFWSQSSQSFRIVLLLSILVYGLRLFLVWFMGITPKDAYYYYYSQNIVLSYYDHPPFIAWVIRVFTELFGSLVWTLKLSQFLITALSVFFVWKLARLFYSNKISLHASLLFASTLAVTKLSLNVTPDTPLTLFWILSMIFIYKGIQREHSLTWILAGFFTGLAFLSKYTAIFIPFGLGLYLIISAEHRKLIFSKNILLYGIFFILTISPVLIWNIREDWISFSYQSGRFDKEWDFLGSIGHFFGHFGIQMILSGPIFFYLLFILFKNVLIQMIKKRVISSDGRMLYILCLSLPMFLFFSVLSPMMWIKMNWIIPCYAGFSLLVGSFISEKMLKVQFIISSVLSILVFLELAFYIIPAKTDNTWVGWKEISKESARIMKEQRSDFIFSADAYKTSSILYYYLPDEREHIYAGNIIGFNGFQFEIDRPNLNHLLHKNALFLDSQKRFKHLNKLGVEREELMKYFETVEELGPIIIKNNKNKVIRKYLVYKCLNYQGSIADDR